MQAAPEANLRLGVTPLGAAFAMVQGWVPCGSACPVRLCASRLILEGVEGTIQVRRQPY